MNRKIYFSICRWKYKYLDSRTVLWAYLINHHVQKAWSWKTIFEMNKKIYYNGGIFIIITKVGKTENSGTYIWLERK